MKIKYFSDTDTALLEFSDAEVAETREINENIYKIYILTSIRMETWSV